jgi:hypothetical protein
MGKASAWPQGVRRIERRKAIMKTDTPNDAELLELHRSWPIFDKARHFELGSLLSCAVIDMIEPGQVGQLGIHHAGWWECDLADDGLTWSGGVYDIFGLPRDTLVSRAEAAGFYREASRAPMERLRSYAIRNKRGFTLDTEISPAIGGRRIMRLIAYPVIRGGRTVRLHGLKVIV